MNESQNAAQQKRQAEAEAYHPRSPLHTKMVATGPSANDVVGISMQVPYRPKDMQGSPGPKGKPGKKRRSKEQEKSKLAFAPPLAESSDTNAISTNSASSKPQRHSYPANPGAVQVPYQPRDWKGSPSGATRRKAAAGSAKNRPTRHSMPELAPATASTTSQGNIKPPTIPPGNSDPKGSPCGKRNAARRRMRKSLEKKGYNIDNQQKTKQKQQVDSDATTIHSEQANNKIKEKEEKIQSLSKQSKPGAYKGDPNQREKKLGGTSDNLQLAPGTYEDDYYGTGLRHAPVLEPHQDYIEPSISNRAIDLPNLDNIVDAEVGDAAGNQQDKQEEVLRGYVVKPHPHGLDEDERYRIIEETRQTAQTNFQQQVVESVQVEGIRVRSRKEELSRSACVVCTIFVVALAIALGILFGVVVKGRDDNGNNVLAANEACEGSLTIGKAILAGQIDLNSATSAHESNVKIPACSTYDNSTSLPGRWYMLEGDGNFLHATTCGGNSTDDLKGEQERRASIALFRGLSCATLACVEATSTEITAPVVHGIPICGASSTIFWTGEYEVQYYLLVYHSDTRAPAQTTISFEISVGRHSRMMILSSYIEAMYEGLTLNPPSSFDAPQYLAAKWLSEEDEYVPIPLQTDENRLELQQRYALSVLYFATNVQNNWSKSLGFLNSTSSVCNWHDVETSTGATCRGQDKGAVTDLVIAYNNLEGTMPNEIAGLSSLVRLDVNDEKFGPALQAISVNLVNLQSLRFRGALKEKVPTEIGLLTSLTSLSLTATTRQDLIGSLPSQLGRLSLLQDLVLHNHNLGTDLPTEIGMLTKLTILSLPCEVNSRDGIVGAIPSEIGSLSNLRVLDLNRCGGISRIPTQFGDLSSLSSLNLAGSFPPYQLSSKVQIIPSVFGSLRSLKELYLENNGLRGSIPSSLGNLEQLTTLTLHNNELVGGTDTICDALGSQLTRFEADCLGQQFPAVEPELTCKCCTRCCSQVLVECVAGNGLPPENNDCTGAYRISLLGTVQGSTRFASTSVILGSCGTAVTTSAGVWYRVTGTGQTLRASTCNQASDDFDSQISIYSGSCNAPVCVDGNNDDCGLQSTVTFDSNAGQEYWILVHGYSSAVGSFALSLTAA